MCTEGQQLFTVRGEVKPRSFAGIQAEVIDPTGLFEKEELNNPGVQPSTAHLSKMHVVMASAVCKLALST